MLVLRTWIK